MNLLCNEKESRDAKHISIHCCISGFRQNKNNYHGVLSLSEKLVDAKFCHGPYSRVWLREWNDDWNTQAEYAWLLSNHYDKPIVFNIYAYSWGAGWGAVQLAKKLYRRGIRVKTMILADPVYRHPLFLFRWLSLFKREYVFFGSPIVHIPANVEEVHSYHQLMNRPQGHKLVADGKTTIHPSRKVCREHSKMDDLYAFHLKCVEASAELLEYEYIEEGTSNIIHKRKER